MPPTKNGAQVVVSAVDGASPVFDGVAKSAKDMGAAVVQSTTTAATATDKLASSTDGLAKTEAGRAAQLERLKQALDPIYKANVDLEKGVRLVNVAMADNDGTEEKSTLLAQLQARYAATTQAIRNNSGAQADATGATKTHSNALTDWASKLGLSQAQAAESVHVVRSLTDSMAAGPIPFGRSGSRPAGSRRSCPAYPPEPC